MSTIEFLSVTEAAKMLKLSDSRVRRLCREKRLGQQVGNGYVISKDELRQFQKIERPAGNPGFRGKKRA